MKWYLRFYVKMKRVGWEYNFAYISITLSNHSQGKFCDLNMGKIVLSKQSFMFWYWKRLHLT